MNASDEYQRFARFNAARLLYGGPEVDESIHLPEYCEVSTVLDLENLIDDKAIRDEINCKLQRGEAWRRQEEELQRQYEHRDKEFIEFSLWPVIQIVCCAKPSSSNSLTVNISHG